MRASVQQAGHPQPALEVRFERLGRHVGHLGRYRPGRRGQRPGEVTAEDPPHEGEGIRAERPPASAGRQAGPAHGTPLGQVLFSSVLLVICVLGLSALATGMGAIWPRLDWTDPRRAVGIWLAVVFMMVGAAYIAICVVGLTLALLITNRPSLGSELLALVVLVGIAGLTAGVTLRAGHSRLLALDV